MDGLSKVGMCGKPSHPQCADTELLRRVVVRPIQPDERVRWDGVLELASALPLSRLWQRS
jgi:hypothetical protein